MRSPDIGCDLPQRSGKAKLFIVRRYDNGEFGRVRAHRGRLFLPTVSTDERHKAASIQRGLSKRTMLALDKVQLLILKVANWYHHAAAFGKLCEKWWRRRGGAGGDNDAVERGEFREAKSAVSAVYMYVRVTEVR